MTAGEPDAATVFFREQLGKAIDEALSPHVERWRRSGGKNRCRVLDVGCGYGHWLRFFRRNLFPSGALIGVDRDGNRLQAARAKDHGSDFILGDAARLPFADFAFDLVTQFVMMTSVEGTENRQRIAREMFRVLKPGGAVLWYDFFAPNLLNRQTRAIGLTELRSLFPGSRLKLRTVTLAPPLARLFLPKWQPVAETLGHVPWLRTHYLALIEPPGGPL